MIVRDQACFNNYNENNVVSYDQSHLIKRHGCVDENLWKKNSLIVNRNNIIKDGTRGKLFIIIKKIAQI